MKHPQPPVPSPFVSSELPRDLAEFHLRWTEFRPSAQAIIESGGLSERQRTTLLWLIALADRIGEADIGRPGY